MKSGLTGDTRSKQNGEAKMLIVYYTSEFGVSQFDSGIVISLCEEDFRVFWFGMLLGTWSKIEACTLVLTKPRLGRIKLQHLEELSFTLRHGMA